MQTITSIYVGSNAIRTAMEREATGLCCDLVDAIQVSHTTRIHDVKMKIVNKCWRLYMFGDGNLLLESWAQTKGTSLFEDVFKTNLEILE